MLAEESLAFFQEQTVSIDKWDAALANGPLVGVGGTDAHQNEYLAAAEERLAWLTGFTGSAGVAVILQFFCVTLASVCV